jgi:chemotaxis protein methyltransferase CheR
VNAVATETFEYVRRLVHETAGIVIEPSKDYLVSARLEPIAEREGFRSIEEMVTDLRRRPKNHMHARLVDAMLTTETSFFRDIHPFAALREVVLPQLVEARRTARSLSIWSAACSSGQEPYSIALLLREHFPELRYWDVTILASDLSQTMLSRAPQGVFSNSEVNRGIPANLLVKYFERRGMNWQIDEEIRHAVRFRQINLGEPWPPLPAMDIVFLRNVLIYLDEHVRWAVLNRVRHILRPDGYLFLGAAEAALSVGNGLQPVRLGQTTCYRLVGGEEGERWSHSTTYYARRSGTSGP